jgi:hypothetical protein
MVMPNTLDSTAQALDRRYGAFFAGRDPVPFAVRLDGQVRRFGPGDPEFTLIVTNPKGLAALESLDLLAVATAYLDGDVELDGDVVSAITSTCSSWTVAIAATPRASSSGTTSRSRTR